jgi:hypothetical protein
MEKEKDFNDRFDNLKIFKKKFSVQPSIGNP